MGAQLQHSNLHQETRDHVREPSRRSTCQPLKGVYNHHFKLFWLPRCRQLDCERLAEQPGACSEDLGYTELMLTSLQNNKAPSEHRRHDFPHTHARIGSLSPKHKKKGKEKKSKLTTLTRGTTECNCSSLFWGGKKKSSFKVLSCSLSLVSCFINEAGGGRELTLLLRRGVKPPPDSAASSTPPSPVAVTVGVMVS